LPLFGYHRRSYLVLAGLLGSLAWVGLATIVSNAWQAVTAMTLASLAIAVSDVIVDSLVVERARQESQGDAGSLQALCWGATAVGGVLTAYFSGFLLAHFGTRVIFGITALFPLIVAGVAVLINEGRTTTSNKFGVMKHQVGNVWQALSQKAIFLPVAFLFLWQATPSSEAAFFFFTTNELGFDAEFLGRVRLVSSLAALLGIWIFQRFLKAIPVRTIFFWSTIISAALGMTTLILVTHANRQLGIDDRWFSLGDSLILTVMGQIAYMPVLVLAARLCPPGIEATLFALLMSISNLANILSNETGALAMHLLGIKEAEFGSLWILVVIANLSTLLPLPLLRWLPETSSTKIGGDSPQSTSENRPELSSV
jgi:folate/biopterin transporter